MDDRSIARFGHRSALAWLVGLILSGPLTVVAIAQLAAQPVEWQGIEAYARAYHPLQLITFGFGFLILLGTIGVMVALHHLAPPERRLPGTLALVCTAIFGSVISINYILQLAVLRPALAAGRLEGLEYLAFNNPDSVAMALEMLGYGFLGLATVAVAPLFPGPGLGRWIRWLGWANGAVSVAGTAAQATVGLPGLAGLVAYVAWNVLILALVALYTVHFRRLVLAPAAVE